MLSEGVRLLLRNESTAIYYLAFMSYKPKAH